MGLSKVNYPAGGSGASAAYPAIESGDADKVLTVSDDETGVEWGDPPAGGAALSFGTEHLWIANDTALPFTAGQTQFVPFDGIYSSAGTSIATTEADLPTDTVTVAEAGLYSVLLEAWMEGPNPGGQIVLQALDSLDAQLPAAQAMVFDFTSPTQDKHKASVTIALPAGAKLKLSVENDATADPQDSVFAAMFICRLL